MWSPTVFLAFILGLLRVALAEDLLFLDTFYTSSTTAYTLANTSLPYTKTIVDQDTWRNMTTADFAKYKAIIIAGAASGYLANIQVLNDTKDVWSPAITGNIVLIGESSSPETIRKQSTESIRRRSEQPCIFHSGRCFIDHQHHHLRRIRFRFRTLV